MPLVLIVDDVRALAEQYAYDLKRVGGYETVIADGGRKAIEFIDTSAADCIILDLEMPEVDGFDVLRYLEKERLPIPVIVYTGTGDFDRCARAIKLGAYSFIDKSESMARVVQEVSNALEHAQLRSEVSSLREELRSETAMIGSSGAMRKLSDQIARLAGIPSPVLILGESGSGKEIVARELHRVGFDDKRSFVALNCAALPENLVESELFGHERGAFTGANRTHRGAFEVARGGTLFLDEIGELPLSAQAKLLRVLEQGNITRVGGERTVNVNARVIAATNRDLDAEAAARRFREDLLYRLNVHTLFVPPLRERKSDIPELVAHLGGGICRRFGIRTKRFAPEVIEVLSNNDWRRNNVRELRNTVERMIIAADGPEVDASHLPHDLNDTPQPESNGSFAERKTEAERNIVVAALNRNDWHISHTAADLQLADHASLLKIMRRLGISRPA